jgi:hypothetical protein
MVNSAFGDDKADGHAIRLTVTPWKTCHTYLGYDCEGTLSMPRSTCQGMMRSTL